MRRQSTGFHILWVIVLLFFYAGATRSAAQMKFEKLHVGYSAQAGSLAPIWITKEAGIFKKHGLDVELLFIPGGPTAAAALMSIFIRPSLFWIPASMPWLRLGETIFPAQIDVGPMSRMHRALLEGWRARLQQLNQGRTQLAVEFSERLSLDLPCGAEHPYLRLPVLAPSTAERDRWLSTSRARGRW